MGDLDLEEKVRAGQQSRVVRRAVGWLLGPELVGQLKKILRKRSDPRDWMPFFRGCVHDECWNHDGRLIKVVEGGGGLEAGSPTITAAQNVQSAERVIPLEMPDREPIENDIWFDFVADMGDAGDSMYAVAYATMVAFDGASDATTWTPSSIEKPLTVASWNANATLPRGQFLFVGGDTAYHVADAPTLKSRVEEPFQWAFNDAQHNGHISKHAAIDDRTRRIYGIPGNHDWYDNLEGFSLVFRLGSPSPLDEDKPPKWWRWKRKKRSNNPIQLPQLERVQLGSYVGIQLPYGWQIWGLDIDSPMDRRQREYFKSLEIPERLIVATPSPAIVFGASIPDEENHRDGLSRLGIPVPALPLDPDAVTPKYRLDISGDVHHYARYFPTQQVATYGSIVSGLGGAFHHPSFTRASTTDERVDAQRQYPTPAQSLEDVGNELLDPASTWYGSWARVIPFVLTVLVGFASLYGVGGSWLFHHILACSPWHARVPVGEGRELLHAGCALGVFALAVGGVFLALLLARRIFEKQTKDATIAQNVVDLWKAKPKRIGRLFDPYRSYWAAWAIALAFASPFLLYPLWGPHAATLRLDIATIIIVFALPIVGGVVGWTVGASHVRVGLKLRVAIVGTLHATAHVITAIVFANLFTATGWSMLAGVGALAVAILPLWLVRGLFKAQSRWCITLLSVIALVLFAASMGLIAWFSEGHYVTPTGHWYWDAARMIGSGVAAMLFGTTWFIWYLAITCRLDAHNNEAGGAARVTKYRQMIRFRVHREGVTGYVISIENDPKDPDPAPHTGGRKLVFRLIDVFTIKVPATKSTSSGPFTTPGVNEIGIPA